MGNTNKRSFFCITRFKFIEIITKGIANYGQSFFGVHFYIIEERISTMQISNSLKMELFNQEYFTDEQYIQFLTHNNLSPNEEF